MGNRDVLIRFRAVGKNFSPSMRRPYWLREPPAALHNDYSVSPRVMQAVCKAERSPYIVPRSGMNGTLSPLQFIVPSWCVQGQPYLYHKPFLAFFSSLSFWATGK